MDSSCGRRAFLSTSGGILASTFLAGNLRAVRESLAHAQRMRTRQQRDWQVLTVDQARSFDAITSQIMPSDETPGAREAGVVNFIDHALGTWAAPQRQSLLDGIADLNRRVPLRWPDISGFAALQSADQAVLLQQVEGTPFFQTTRFLTLLGMFSLPVYYGNLDKVGWRLIGFDDRHVWRPPFGYYDAELTNKS